MMRVVRLFLRAKVVLRQVIWLTAPKQDHRHKASQHVWLAGSRPLVRSNSGSPRFTDFPSLCACSESSLTNLIGSSLDLLCLQSHSKLECRWTWPGVPIFLAHVKRDPWGRGWVQPSRIFPAAVQAIMPCLIPFDATLRHLTSRETTGVHAKRVLKLSKAIFTSQ